MKILAAAVVALGLLSSAVANAQCATPAEDAAQLLEQHKKKADYLLEGEKAQAFARKTGAPEAMVPMVTAVQMWLQPGDASYLVTFYINGCRAGAFSLAVDDVINNVSVFKPMPFTADLRARGA